MTSHIRARMPRETNTSFPDTLSGRRTTDHHTYRGYLIRWSIFTLDKPDSRVWVEKDTAFICWANNVDDAKLKIDEVVS